MSVITTRRRFRIDPRNLEYIDKLVAKFAHREVRVRGDVKEFKSIGGRSHGKRGRK